MKAKTIPAASTHPTNSQTSVFDVVVIGGGPAGMMAAGRAAELGAKVCLIEKNDTLGKKLLITGGGRCNVTNAEPDIRKLLARFRGSDQYLFSAFSQWGVAETFDFFHKNNMPTKIEALQRAFPASEKAQSVWDVLVDYMGRGKVTVISDTTVTGFETSPAQTQKSAEKNLAAAGNSTPTITAVSTRTRGKGASEIVGKTFILATGGISRPETGSTGDGYVWLRALGHNVIEPRASLVPVAVKEAWIKRVAGVSLPNAKVTFFQNNVKQDSKRGKILFTHVGLSGPLILNMSNDIGESLKYGDVTLALDILPDLDHGMLNTKLQEIFLANAKKKFKNSIDKLMPAALASVMVFLSKIDPDLKCSSISREQRLALITLLKGAPLTVKHLLGTDKAVITSGGVVLDEVDFKTMRSRKAANLHVVGDLLNIDRPSGGYSLQLCWTTGFVAGSAAGVAEKIVSIKKAV